MDPNQVGGGLAFANALGVSYSQGQIRGAPTTTSNVVNISSVSLSQSGNLIFATPGDTSVDIGQTITGQNTQYVQQMAGTTMINSPLILNGNVVIPHTADFSHNPENSTDYPQHLINATVVFKGDTFYVDNINTEISSLIYLTGEVGVNGPTTIQGNTTITGTTNFFGTTSITGDGSIFAPNAIGLTSPGANITLDSNLTLTGNSNININTSNINSHTSNQNSNYAGRQIIIADGGINPAYEAYVNIISQSGYQGRINLDAYAGFQGTTLGGAIKINAHGGDNPFLNYGGLISLNAYSGPLGEYGGLTSAIELNAASIRMAAGGYTIPQFTLAGSMAMYGQGLISIVSALSPPALVQTPESVYLYGNGGCTFDGGYLGIYNKSDTYFNKSISPDNFSAGLNITSNSVNGTPVYISGLQSLAMTASGGGISGVKTINTNLKIDSVGNISTGKGFISSLTVNQLFSPSLFISSLSTITTDTFALTSLSSINGVAFATSNLTTPWYQVVPPLFGNILFGGNNLSNIGSINVGGHLYTQYDIWTNYITNGNNSNVGLRIAPQLGDLTITNDDNVNNGTVILTKVSKLNEYEYIPTLFWSGVPASSDVNINFNSIYDANQISAQTISPVAEFKMALPKKLVDFNNTDLKGVSSINGTSITSIVNSWVGLATTDLNMNMSSIVNTQNMTAELFLATNSVITHISTTNLTAFGDMNLNLNNINNVQRITANNATLNGTLTTANVSASGDVQAVSVQGLGATFTNASITTLTGVATINGAAYPPPSGGWVGTATSPLNMAGYAITGASGVSASGFNTTSVNVNATSITIGSTTLDGGGLGATGISVSYANVSGNVSAASLSTGPITATTINGTKIFTVPNVNLYIASGQTTLYYRAVAPGTINVQSATATQGGDLSVQVDIYDVDNIPGEYRFVNANGVNNMNIQFTTVNNGNFYNWGQNTQTNPGESILCRVWYNNYQGRYVITNIQKDGNPSPTN